MLCPSGKYIFCNWYRQTFTGVMYYLRIRELCFKIYLYDNVSISIQMIKKMFLGNSLLSSLWKLEAPPLIMVLHVCFNLNVFVKIVLGRTNELTLTTTRMLAIYFSSTKCNCILPEKKESRGLLYNWIEPSKKIGWIIFKPILPWSIIFICTPPNTDQSKWILLQQIKKNMKTMSI